MYLLLLLALPLAPAAEVTDMAPELKGDLSIAYAGAWESGSIVEGDEQPWGTRRDVTHDLTVTAEFVPVERLAVWLAVEQTLSRRLAFDGAHAMVPAPLADTGTYEGGDPLSDVPVRAGAALDGLWLGLAAAPFAERYGRGADMTWRLDLAVRTPNPGATFWSAVGERRGAAPGGVGWLVRGAWSKKNAPADGYLVATLRREEAITIEVDGDEVRIDPSDNIDLRGGVEIIGGENPDTGEKFALDLFTGAGFTSRAEVVSGVLLPDVLDRTDGQAVRTAPVVHGTAGLGMIGWFNEYVGARVAGTATYFVPHRIEAPYPARTGLDTVRAGLEASIEGRLR